MKVGPFLTFCIVIYLWGLPGFWWSWLCRRSTGTPWWSLVLPPANLKNMYQERIFKMASAELVVMSCPALARKRIRYREGTLGSGGGGGGGGGGHSLTRAISFTILPALHSIVVLSFSPSNFPRTIILLSLSSNSIFSMEYSSVAPQNYLIDEFIEAHTLVHNPIAAAL